MCSPSEIEKLLKDDSLYKQYILQKLIRIEEKLNSNCSDVANHSDRIDELSKDIEELKAQIVILNNNVSKIQSDISFFKKLIAGLITVIGSLLGIQLGII